MRLRYVDTYLRKHDEHLVGFCRTAFERLAARTRLRWQPIGGATLLKPRHADVVFFCLPLNLALLQGQQYQAVMSFLDDRIPTLRPKLVFFEFGQCLYLTDIVYGSVYRQAVRRCAKVLESVSGQPAVDLVSL